jgi:hypothetical protein
MAPIVFFETVRLKVKAKRPKSIRQQRNYFKHATDSLVPSENIVL